MRAWWWVLVTAHLVWGNPEPFKDLYGNAVSLQSNPESFPEEEVHSSLIFSPKAYTKIRRSPEEEREKKQAKFHSWGGKRHGGEEEEEVGEIGDAEGHVRSLKLDDEDLLKLVSSYLLSNASDSKTEDLGNNFRETLTKRTKQTPAFSSWGGKRDPEMVSDLMKRTNLYSPIFQQNVLDSNLEQSRKRYPSFNSWAGKRAAAFNSWAGKRAAAFNSWGGKRDYSTDKQSFTNNTENLLSVNGERMEFDTSQPNLLNSDGSLDPEPDGNTEDDRSTKAPSQDEKLYLPMGNDFQPPIQNSALKRANAFNSWAGKRKAAFNSWAEKRVAAFNSWGGKRIPQLNPWVVKKPLAFNSWAGKRAAAFNSWGGKRAAAFNSWGGKRAAAFNSWGGKRAGAFNSWGGKRAAAFNSWGGKRTAAFNSWGGKRAAAFNSWGEKRYTDKNSEIIPFENPVLKTDKNLYLIALKLSNTDDPDFDAKLKKFLDLNDKSIENQGNTMEHLADIMIDKNILSKNHYIVFNDEESTNSEIDELKNEEEDHNHENMEKLAHTPYLEKRAQPFFSSWAGKRSPLFSSWYGSKIPTVLLTNGKRRPAFSSWGGKRSEHQMMPQQQDCLPENMTLLKSEKVQSEEPDTTLQSLEDNDSKRKKRELNCGSEENSALFANNNPSRDKRATGNYIKNRVFTRMMLQGGFNWPMALKSLSRSKDFYAWGGKRSL